MTWHIDIIQFIHIQLILADAKFTVSDPNPSPAHLLPLLLGSSPSSMLFHWAKLHGQAFFLSQTQSSLYHFISLSENMDIKMYELLAMAPNKLIIRWKFAVPSISEGWCQFQNDNTANARFKHHNDMPHFLHRSAIKDRVWPRVVDSINNPSLNRRFLHLRAQNKSTYTNPTPLCCQREQWTTGPVVPDCGFFLNRTCMQSLKSWLAGTMSKSIMNGKAIERASKALPRAKAGSKQTQQNHKRQNQVCDKLNAMCESGEHSSIWIWPFLSYLLFMGWRRLIYSYIIWATDNIWCGACTFEFGECVIVFQGLVSQTTLSFFGECVIVFRGKCSNYKTNVEP